jgi:hypothetical protein
MQTLWQTLLQKLPAAVRERVHRALTPMALRHQRGVPH